MTVRELEVEVLAFLLDWAVGVQMRTTSGGYIVHYHGKPSKPAESLKAVQHASDVTLSGILPTKRE